MPIRHLVVAAVAMLVSTCAQAADLTWDDPVRLGVGAVWNTTAAEPPPTPLLVGDHAPAFSYLDAEGQWQRSRDLASERPVVLLFGASDESLIEIERARALFLDLGVTLVVVSDRKVAAAYAQAERLGLTSRVVADPKCAIGDLFNTLNPVNHRHAPSFFVMDETRTIRAIQHGPLPSSIQLLIASARALGRPLPESAWVWVTG